MLAGVDEIADDRFLAQRSASFEAMQPFDQHEPRPVLAHQDRRLLADFEHALGELRDGLRD